MASLRAWAVANGCSEAELASELLETIARDNLYDAVLDSAKPAKSPVVLPEMRGGNSSTPSLPSARINAGPTPCRAERKQSGPQA
jgi:hypothetical protein